MKSYAEIMRLIAENRNEIARITQESLAVSREMPKEIQRLKLEKAILDDNRRQTFVAETLPVVLEILGKYAGKPYGEKTKQKISDEAKARINCAVYINDRKWDDKIVIVPLNENGFSVGNYGDFDIVTTGSRPLLVDNKIQVYDISDYRLSYCNPYVEDVQALAEQILSSFDTIRRLEATLSNEIVVLNALLPTKVPSIESRFVSTLCV